ncbi:MAG: Ig-like domain-containing protein, partial [Thermoplasmata archaeon]
TIPGDSSEIVSLEWNLPEGTSEGPIKAAFFVSPGNAPLAMVLLVPVTLTVDMTPPEVLQTLPADGSVTSDSTPAILAGFSDSIGTMDSTSISLWLDGVDITSMSVVSVTFDSDLGGYATGTVSYIPTAPLVDGMHTVRTQVGDSAGNLEEFTWQFYVDTTIPLLQIDYPSTDTTITTDSIMITGTTESGTTVAIRSEDVPVASDGTFSYMFDQLGEGANWLTVVAVDSVGNTATATRLITVDTIPPDLEYPVITSEPLGKPTNAQTLTVSGKFSEIVELTIAGKEVPVKEDGTFETTIPLEEGVNTIVIEAHDAAGHTFTSNDTVITKDTVAPTLTASILAENIDPLTGEALVSMINVTGTVSSDVEIVTVNGLPVIPSQGAFSKQVTLSYGTNEITVIAKDGAGNTATRALSVIWSPEFEVTKQTWTTVILLALAIVLLIVGLLIGLMIGRRPTIEEEVFEEEIPPEEEEAVEEIPEEEEMLEEEPLEEIEMPEEPPAEEVSPEEVPPEEPPEETRFPEEGEP